jgi:DNA-binding CsgD family transcriptional regulator/tetratricopeptide (TPR) repeat protein
VVGSGRPRQDVDERQAAGWLFGRESEVASIGRLLDDARRSRAGVLVLRGEAGSGKSALLDLALGRASGMRVLRVVGVEPESELAFAALHRLLHPVLLYVDRIPDVQAKALRIAMGIAPGETDNRFVIGLAVLSLLSEVATEGPILCLIDDAQWLDQPSADALGFVARRLEAEGIVMLFSARDGDQESFPGVGLPERALASLGAVEAEDLLIDRLGPEVAPEVRREIIESAQGLPLALLEIPAALTDAQLSGHEALPRPMPMGHQLEDILLERVRRLAAPAQLLLLVAAAEGSGEAEVVLSAAAVLGIPPSSLVEAEASGLIHGEGTLLVFRHPLLRSAIYQGASLPQRQSVHHSLVEVLSGEANADRRAWHRAALVLYPDDEIADELARTAERARSRGGHAAAAGALRRAAELTSSDDRRARRLVAAARAAWDAGLPDEATVLLRSIETDEDVDAYAEARHVLGEIEFNCGMPLRGATVLMEGAERVAATDPRKALQMLFDAAQCANYAGDTALMREAGRRASTVPIRRSEPESTVIDLLIAMLTILEGKDTRDRSRLPEMLDRVADVTEPRWLVWAGAAAALAGDQVRDEAFRRRAESIARRSMAVGSLTMVLARMAWTELFNKGRLTAASSHAEEGLQLALESGLTNAACFNRAILAWIAAVRGDQQKCVSLAEQASQTALGHGIAAHNSVANWAIGALHLGLGRWDDAAARLESVWSFAPGTGHPHVAMLALPDLVEAWVRAGRLDLAAPGATRFADYAGEVAPGRLLALSTRCRALVADSPEAKEKLLSEALTFHDRDPRPFDRARTLLLLGEHLRRERRRAEARVPLRAALDTFDQLSATPWSDRARHELRASGQRVRRRDEASLTELTLQERQVTALVGEGATNKEVAAQLFLSPRTVEYHLRNVFAKLQISSRSELARIRLDDLSTGRIT